MSENITIDLGNLQGLVYKHYPVSISRHILLKFTDAALGRSFLGFLCEKISTAEQMDNANSVYINIGITFNGLKKIGVATEILNEFPDDFVLGPIDRLNGDFGESSSNKWWNQKFQTSEIHAIVHLFADTDSEIEELTDTILQLSKSSSVQELHVNSTLTSIEGRQLGNGQLHFGYRDGISQPDIAWSDQVKLGEKVDFRHFILGYSSPEVSSSPKKVSSRVASGMAEQLVRDGTYSAVRWIYQDVAKFNKFLETAAAKTFPQLEQNPAEELLAAKLLGRWRDGTPLSLSPENPDPGLSRANNFSYRETDQNGLKCPFQAHIRIVNPRDQELDFSEGKFVPRLIRRGTPWGPKLVGTVDDGQERGLIGIFLCSDIAGQFYKVMAWMRKTDFSPVFTGHTNCHDPFVNTGLKGQSSDFVIPNGAGDKTVQLQDFLKTKGTAFFFLPSIRSLRQLSQGRYLSISG